MMAEDSKDLTLFIHFSHTRTHCSDIWTLLTWGSRILGIYKKTAVLLWILATWAGEMAQRKWPLTHIELKHSVARNEPSGERPRQMIENHFLETATVAVLAVIGRSGQDVFATRQGLEWGRTATVASRHDSGG